jgi:hypothetical protein
MQPYPALYVFSVVQHSLFSSPIFTSPPILELFLFPICTVFFYPLLFLSLHMGPTYSSYFPTFCSFCASHSSYSIALFFPAISALSVFIIRHYILASRFPSLQHILFPYIRSAFFCYRIRHSHNALFSPIFLAICTQYFGTIFGPHSVAFFCYRILLAHPILSFGPIFHSVAVPSLAALPQYSIAMPYHIRIFPISHSVFHSTIFHSVAFFCRYTQFRSGTIFYSSFFSVLLSVCV